MSVVGVNYAPGRIARRGRTRVTRSETDVPIREFSFLVKGSAKVLYDCDEATWFAILHDEGAYATRPEASNPVGTLNMVEAKYADPSITPSVYFGGVAAGQRGYCVVTRSDDATRAFILEVLPAPHVPAWQPVRLDGGGDLHTSCKHLLHGKIVTCCYPEHSADLTHETMVIATRELLRLASGQWVLSEHSVRARFPCARVNASDVAMRVTDVCAVASGLVFVSVAHVNGRLTVHKVDLNEGASVSVAEDAFEVTLWQSRNEVYVNYKKHTYFTIAPGSTGIGSATYIKGLTNGVSVSPARTNDTDLATLPGHGIILTHRTDGNDEEPDDCRQVMRMVNATPPCKASVIARTAWFGPGSDTSIQDDLAYTSFGDIFVWFGNIVGMRMEPDEFDDDNDEELGIYNVGIYVARVFQVDTLASPHTTFTPMRSGSTDGALRLVVREDAYEE